MILAMMIPFYALGVLYSRVVISLRKTHLMLLCSGVVFVVNVIADIVLKDLIGINGIAMATVINYALQLTLMWFITRKMLRQLSGPNLNLHAI